MKTGLTLHHTAILFLPVIVSTLVAFTSGKRYVVKFTLDCNPPTPPYVLMVCLLPVKRSKKNGPKNGLKNGIKKMVQKWLRNGPKNSPKE